MLVPDVILSPFSLHKTQIFKKGKKMASPVSYIRQASSKWVGGGGSTGYITSESCGCCEESLKEMEGLNMYGVENHANGGLVMRKRVMVLIDETSHAKHAMMWALTHLTNKGDLLTLLHLIPPNSHHSSSSSYSPYLANSLGSLCKASKPEVEVEALVIQGPKLATVISQVKKLEVSMLVLGQKKPSPFISCFCGSSRTEEFVDQCIKNAECLTIGVRKQSKGMGGYLISTRWQKNFWLLA